ncbi:DUF2334 domain-containing protein [Larsenimonas rhizosphaerae]|uniref:DUF2334 domain-containing protein n=1 Tax=Larsenimonas rhizosphaerae TaxID=2944682 RepID=UPI0020336ED0|nr:polysaccharide deacetylase family protein [Larsenimonas rhizosphaerae]MCM2130877.1 polysaccharide deacetylase family protein [Larsenimonas rhizosphaerae]
MVDSRLPSASMLVALHDIAPQTWEDYRPFVETVDRLSVNVPMSWLVVPQFHHGRSTFDDPAFLKLLESRLTRGDELILHGFYHCDDGPRPRTPHEYFMRRIYTYEGEFYGLPAPDARARLEEGIALFERQGWPLKGFVAPAWLMSDGTRHALAQSSLEYTTDPKHIYSLPTFEAHDAPTLVWSARSAWRRKMSYVVNEVAKRRHQQADVLRLGLHPVDMRHKVAFDYWLSAIEQMMDEGRAPLTKHQWLCTTSTQRRSA